jgi:hypothetical protein
MELGVDAVDPRSVCPYVIGMEHAEFTEGLKSGALQVDVDRARALRVAGSKMAGVRRTQS